MTKHVPTGINLHQKSRLLEIAFADGKVFKLPCEYLRVFSPAAEVRIARQPVHGKAQVNISQIEPQGHYAVRLFFDDGHDSGVYSWDTLYRLGMDYEQNWASYLQQLAQHQLERGVPAEAGERQIKLLYFMHLADLAGRQAEDLSLPGTVDSVSTLLAWLRQRGTDWERQLGEAQVQVTVNKQFAEASTPLAAGDEVALVPRAR
jgi:DUF971 family protein/molybdopterin converting factor small subunit